MKKITFVCFFVFLILLIASPCAASESGSEPEFTYNQLSANLYCNDYQIDLSRYPLLEICDEITEHDVVYVSAGLHAINEILELYELYRYSDRAFYTRDYLDQSDKWMSRAEFEANLKFHLRENQKTLYYDEGNHEVFYDAGSRASVYIRTLSCGEDYYIDKEWFLKYTNNLEEIMAGVIDKTKITNYNPGYSFVPVIYPNVNEDFFCKEDGKEYDLTRGVNHLELIKNGVLLHPDSPFLLQKYNEYLRFEVNNGERINIGRHYIPLKLTYEALGYAVISDAEKQNYFIYSEDYIKENPDWKTVDKMQNIFSALANFTEKNVTVKYDENEKKLFFENESVTYSVEAAAFGKNAYVRISDAVNVYKKISDTH